jgi:outer membrane immunogenic protein
MRHAIASTLALGLLAAPAAADQPYSWTGFYIGAHVGYATGNVDHAQTNGGMPYGPFSYDASGALGGLTAGYNLQLGHAVLGVEAEGGYMDLTGDGKIPSSQPGHFQAIDVDGGAYGLIAGRLGLAFGKTLVYGKGGYAYVDGDAGQKTNGVGYETVRSDAFQGAVYGAGIEQKLTDRISIKFEWLRFDFDTVHGYQVNVGDSSSPPGYHFDNKTDVDADSFKVGVNYKLN